MADKMRSYKFNVVHNPFGTTYNPLSIADQLNAIRSQRRYDVVDLEKFSDQWISFDHHGSFAAATSSEAIELIGESMSNAVSGRGKYRRTIISLGTAWAWFREGAVVNNCHRLPERSFEFRMLSIEEMTTALSVSISRWQDLHPDHLFILTVSPVRHLRSGFEDNNRSKARLIETAHALAESLPGVIYYPSYELVMDDLRDYRFFDQSLVHPSTEAIQYVWEHFSGTFFDQHTLDTIAKFESFRKALWHRPGNTSSEAFKGHLQALENKFLAWVQRWPDADWTEEKRRWNELMRLQ